MVEVLNTLIGLVVLAGVFLVITAPVFLLMQKLGLPNKYLALIPLVHLFFIAQIGENSPWLLLALLIPLVNIFVLIYLWYSVCENVGVSTGWAWLNIFPLFGIAGSWVIALSAPTAEWRPHRS